MTRRSPEPQAPAAGWRGGWLRAARRLASPNHDARPAGAVVDLIVVHSISLPPGEYGGGQVRQLFTNRLDWDAHPYFAQIRGLRVSSHFFIERGGALWQFVSADQRAWHAGRSHYRGRSACNDDSLGIELEGLEGHDFEPAQYAALSTLCATLARRHPIAWIAGHEHIAPARKADPGAGFDWAQLSRALAGSGMALPPGVLFQKQ
ncbi:1,6-anhydro-N-acetylmuramyl-L-alanine amidase AmpD [Melaminivora suipulveris]|uniref:1,6-anhydro-N-acetylmuramyl-L-alanine amidase AmpD n=1 Tax=Melaminivora suipulveris TaxID=2109913 RepID=A0A2R3QDN3_9BURK|nr:1,6-anhydro-N-acetylmuramyl-L-alanine amidase AmpD [Melaminivora suipulveris]AVO49889.1 1,6-anhydro-N-acetylmuramyl-L-alanine amidase AmpD [Melaminivora suipulveris]